MNFLQKLWILYRANKSFYEWDEEKIQSHQEKQISYILDYARTHSQFYRKLLSKNENYSLSSVPEINKSVMMDNFNEINTAGLDRETLINFRIVQEKEGNLDLFANKFSIGMSSGTSGSRGLVALSKDEMQKYSVVLWARKGTPKSLKKHRVLFALRTNNPSFMEAGRFGNIMVYVDYTKSPIELIKIINEKKLNVLAGPPSLLTLISNNIDHLHHKIEAIVSYAEVLDEDIKADLERSFSAPVAQIYQGSEGFIASTCREGTLHINEDLVYLDLRSLTNEIEGPKNIIITDLFRTTQPIINYALNDVIEIDSEFCHCGSKFRVVKKIHGRADDIFHLLGEDDEIKYLFPDYVRRSIIKASMDIVEYQAIQHSFVKIEIRLVLTNENQRSEIETTIHQNLMEYSEKIKGKLGNITFNSLIPEKNQTSHKLIRVSRRF